MSFTVQELIKDRRGPVTVHRNSTAQRAVELMVTYDFSQLPVVDDDNRPCGMVTTDSILHAHNSLDLPLKKLRVRDAMAKTPRIFTASGDLFEMLEDVMDADAVFIVDGEGRLAAIVTCYDTTEYFRRRAEDMMLVEDIETMLKEHLQSAYPESDALARAVEKVSRERNSRERFTKALRHYLGVAKVENFDEALASAAFEKQFGGQDSVSFSDLSLSEYIQMLVHGERWDSHFRELFGTEREGIKHMLERVRKTRNSLMHFHGEIDAMQRNHLRFCADWFSRHTPPAFETNSTVSVAAELPKPPEAAPELPDLERARTEVLGEDDSRYTPLALHLQGQPGDVVGLTFAQIEYIIGGKLPAHARKHASWWANDSVGHVQSKQWLGAGWRMTRLSLRSERVTFTRVKERARSYANFFTSLLEELERSAPGLSRATAPSGANWIAIRYLADAGGPRMSYLAFSFLQRNRFRVELYLDDHSLDVTKARFDRICSRRQEIEAQLGEVSWERLDDRRASRIGLYHSGSILGQRNELDSLRKWAVQKMVELSNVLARLNAEGVVSLT